MVEWAEGAGLNWRKLKAQLRSGNRSREKLIQANLRMVHYVAKNYQGRGLSLEDLLQVVLDIPLAHYCEKSVLFKGFNLCLHSSSQCCQLQFPSISFTFSFSGAAAGGKHRSFEEC